MSVDERIRELMLANLFAVFSERDSKRRMKVIARNYTEDVIWSDPDGTARGHDALNEQAQKLLDRMPDFVFSAAGPVHIRGDLACSASTSACRNSRRRSAASTWPWCGMDGSRCYTRS
jgi:SnoaL-like protein